MASGEYSSLTRNRFLGISSWDIFHRSLVRSDRPRDNESLIYAEPRWIPLTGICNSVALERFKERFLLRSPMEHLASNSNIVLDWTFFFGWSVLGSSLGRPFQLVQQNLLTQLHVLVNASTHAYFGTSLRRVPIRQEPCANFYLTAHVELFVVNSSQRFRPQLARSCSGGGV